MNANLAAKHGETAERVNLIKIDSAADSGLCAGRMSAYFIQGAGKLLSKPKAKERTSTEVENVLNFLS